MNLSQLDKSKWTPHRFDEIATMVSERVDPNETDLDIYVGLEHIDPENLHITRHGSSDDVNGTKLRFYPGDVIFGRRRAYQRKAAIAESHGFCSAHAMVLRAKPAVIDPNLFPFFLHSDQFMHRAVDISVGSLSPTINWKSLRKQPFLLPPKAEQARLAELLWAGDAVVEGLEAINSRQSILFNSWLNSNVNKSKNWSKRQLHEIAKVQTGLVKNSKRKIADPISLPYLRVANVQDGYLDLSEIKEIEIDRKDFDRFSVQMDDLLLTEGGDFDKLGRGHLWNGEIETCVHQNHVFVVRSNKEIILPEFLTLVTRSNYGKGYFLSRAKRTSNLASINSTQIKKFPALVPSLKVQEAIVQKATSLSATTNKVTDSICAAKSLQKSLINQIF